MVKLIIVESATLEKNDKATLKRIADKHVGYMELSTEVSGFACGNCRSLNNKGFCENPDVQAYVSANHGCCNYFYPKAAGSIRFPKGAK
jgi:hypothetical protein